mgnify:CR=1 FL=1
MKTATTLLLTAATAFAFSASAATYKFVATNDRPGTLLCVSAAENNLLSYKGMSKRYRISQRYVANNLTCNGENIATFAATYGATKTAAYINRYHKGKVSITDIAKASQDRDKNAAEDEVIVVMVR